MKHVKIEQVLYDMRCNDEIIRPAFHARLKVVNRKVT